MPTGQTPAPQLPPPTAPPPTASSSPSSTNRRHRTFSSSSSSSSSLSTASSAASSPSPSPRGRGTTSVPFSWEHHPGIPKTRLGTDTASSPPTPAAPLPLPPPSRPRHHPHPHQSRRRRGTGSRPPADASGDPFAAALAECTRPERGCPDDDAGLMDTLFPPRARAPGSRRWSAGGFVGLLDLYGCKTAMGVAEGAVFVVRRPVAVARPVGTAAGRAVPGRAARR